MEKGKKGERVQKGEVGGGKAREQVFGLTIPLLTTSSGEKFGKSVGNPVWLNEKMTSVFDFYQVSLVLSSSFSPRSKTRRAVASPSFRLLIVCTGLLW